MSAPAGTQENPQANACVAIFRHAVTRHDALAQQSLVLNTIYDNACSASNRSLTANFDSKTQTLVQGIPVVSNLLGSLGISSNKQFCRAYESKALNLQTLDYASHAPVVDALAQANVCLGLASRYGVTLAHTHTHPANVAFNGIFHGTEMPLRLSVAQEGNFTCKLMQANNSVPISTDRELEVKHNFNISCQRSGTIDAGDVRYGPGEVKLLTSAGHYVVTANPDRVLGYNSQREAAVKVESAQARAADAEGRLLALQTTVDGRKVETHRFYFGQRDLIAGRGSVVAFSQTKNVVGRRFGCQHWSYKPQSYWEPIVKQALCPAADRIHIARIRRHAGGDCGYNYFNMICETMGEPGAPQATTAVAAPSPSY